VSWWAIGVKSFVTVVISWATFRLLCKEVTPTKYNSALLGLFVVAVLWIADIENSTRIVAGVFEIDRRVELAQDAIHRLDELTKKATDTEARLSDLTEKESLRRWAMVLLSGDEVVGAYGSFVLTGGPLSDSHTQVFREKEEGWEWGCDDKDIADLTALIEHRPERPYASAARASCLKKKGDPSWRVDTERAKKQLEKLKAVEPHAPAIDKFYEICERLLG